MATSNVEAGEGPGQLYICGLHNGVDILPCAAFAQAGAHTELSGMKVQAAREVAAAQRGARRVEPKTAMIAWMEGHGNRHHAGRVVVAQDRTGEAQAELAGVKAQAAAEVAAAQRAAGRAKAAAAELAEDLEAARDEAEREAVLRQACLQVKP